MTRLENDNIYYCHVCKLNIIREESVIHVFRYHMGWDLIEENKK
jgi:hypothetical protein